MTPEIRLPSILKISGGSFCRGLHVASTSSLQADPHCDRSLHDEYGSADERLPPETRQSR